MFRSVRALGTIRSPAASLLTLLALCVSAPSAAAQSNAELKAELERERAARQALEARVAQLETFFGQMQPDSLEMQLRGLVAPEELAAAGPRPPVSRTIYNPQIGVFMDTTIEGGNFDNKLGAEDSDRTLLRETEIDFRTPIAPFADGVAILALENLGGGEFEAKIEEGYADVSLGGLFDTDTRASAKIGRMRPKFGRNNQLHLHDWLQANQPVAVRNLLGEEGVVGDGIAFNIPVAHFGDEAGSGQTTTLDVAVVNGDLLGSEHGPLGELAEEAGLELDSDDPIAVARLSHFVELGELSDVEVGVSTMQRFGDMALYTDAGTSIEPEYFGADITVRTRDDETGQGSWLFQAETIQSTIDFEDAMNPDFPVGSEDNSGWWFTAQRQVTQNAYVGVRYGRSDVIGTGDVDESIAPYVSWYADEFFRIRAQVERLNRNVKGGPDIDDVTRAILQFTWNFGAHRPHPYWTNR
ncbi:MAG: hypothetical protein ACYTCU_02895 [Planctomycetota bacterium]